MKEKISRHIFQSAIGVLFGYYGFLALINPGLEASKWVSEKSASIIEILISANVFVLILGIAQIGVASLLIAGKYSDKALIIAAILLLGIIINLGWNEVALRDFVILTGVIYLYFSNRTKKRINISKINLLT